MIRLEHTSHTVTFLDISSLVWSILKSMLKKCLTTVHKYFEWSHLVLFLFPLFSTWRHPCPYHICQCHAVYISMFVYLSHFSQYDRCSRRVKLFLVVRDSVWYKKHPIPATRLVLLLAQESSTGNLVIIRPATPRLSSLVHTARPQIYSCLQDTAPLLMHTLLSNSLLFFADN